MGQITLQIPQVGQPDTTEDPKVASDFTVIQATINGGLDQTNLAAALAQSASVNQSGQTVKGAVNIATSQSTSSTSYTTLATPDQVTGIVLPANGLIQVWYAATWQESVLGAARAAVFVGANQSKGPAQPSPIVQETGIGNQGAGVANRNVPLLSVSGGGLSSGASDAGAYTGDVTTGQVVQPFSLFLSAGTYTVSVQFKASSGSVTASNRKLWVRALSFA